MGDWREHGGRIEAARAEWGGARADWLDLSTGINPQPWPGAVAVAIDWRALPDPEALAALEAAAAAYFGIGDAAICAVPGSEIGLRVLGSALAGEAVHVAPGYRTHEEAFPESTAIGFDAIGGALAAGRTVLLANPNNPDGRLVSPEHLVEHARAGGTLIVDEAFADALPAASLAPHLAPDRPIVLLRSFGKMFGLAGVRLGFVIGPEPVVAVCRARLGSWPVSAAAIAIGTAAYRDRDWIAATRTRLEADAAALDAVLARHGLATTGACSLFRLVETPDAAALFERLARSHILTRPFDYRPDWLRIGLPGSVEGLARLDAALARG